MHRSISTAITAFSLVGLMGLAACGPTVSPDEVAVTYNVPSAMERDDGLVECGRTWVPEGTTTEMMPDGSMNFRAPEGFSVIHHRGTARGQLNNQGTVNCTCTKGKGNCSPASSGDSIGCIIGPGCTTCTRTASATVVNHRAGVRFATADDLATLPLGSSYMLEVPELVDALRAFQKTVEAEAGDDAFVRPSSTDHDAMAAQPDHALIPLAAFGRVLYAKMKRGSVKRLGLAGMALAAKGSCNCTSGSSGCVYWSKFGYYGCDAGSCNSCSLTTSATAFEPAGILGFER